MDPSKTFVSIDVETANYDLASICQVGIAVFKDKCLVDVWKSYIDPEDFFSPINTAIHGIDEERIKGAPKLPEVRNQIHKYLDGQTCICHTHFDRVAIQQAFVKYGKELPSPIWLDSALVARRAWEQFAFTGYGLKNVCEYLGYEFLNHDALEDAKAAGHIIISAIDKTGLDIDGWLKRVKQPIDPDPMHSSIGNNIERDGNPEGPLYGEVLVFTGALSVHRDKAADMAAEIGCKVETGVNARTTMLVVGNQDLDKLAGFAISSKQRKAEALIAKGHQIRILKEADFSEIAHKGNY